MMVILAIGDIINEKISTGIPGRRNYRRKKFYLNYFKSYSIEIKLKMV
jgi:hypothetical protein